MGYPWSLDSHPCLKPNCLGLSSAFWCHPDEASCFSNSGPCFPDLGTDNGVFCLFKVLTVHEGKGGILGNSGKCHALSQCGRLMALTTSVRHTELYPQLLVLLPSTDWLWLRQQQKADASGGWLRDLGVFTSSCGWLPPTLRRCRDKPGLAR